MPATPDLIDQVDEAIAALVRLRAQLAADLPPVGPNGSGETLARLRAAAVELGARISGDDRIGEHDAALLIGIEPGSLRKRRQEGAAPPSYRTPVFIGRVISNGRIVPLTPI